MIREKREENDVKFTVLIIWSHNIKHKKPEKIDQLVIFYPFSFLPSINLIRICSVSENILDLSSTNAESNSGPDKPARSIKLALDEK